MANIFLTGMTRRGPHPGTLAYHLGHVFTKLGINSRMQLHRVLPTSPNVT